MKIVLAMPYSNPPSWGVENVAYSLTQGFARLHKKLEIKGIEIIILSNRGTRFRPTKITYPCPQIKIIAYKQIRPITLLGDINSTVLLKCYLQDLVLSADIIHSHDITFSLPAAKFATNKRVIHNFHGLPWNEKKYLSSRYSRFSYGIITNKIKKLIEFKNTEFVAISHFVAKEIQQVLGISDKRSSIIYDPVPDDFFSVRKRENDGLIFYPARLISRKNHIPLIKALGIIKKDSILDFKLALTGPIEDRKYYSNIVQVIKRNDLEKNVMFLGKISKKELLECYSEASIVVLTSLEESFSLTIAEAMATGTPVIASPVGVVPEIIKDHSNGFIIDPLNPADIAKKIRMLLEDKKLRKKIGKENKETAQKWKAERICNELIKLWEC